MSDLKLIYHLLREEYALSRHLFWLEADHPVNDVTLTLRMLVQAARGLRRQDETAWRNLVVYALERGMSARLLIAISQYLRGCGHFPTLPLIECGVDAPQLNWQGGTVPLLDESDVPGWQHLQNARSQIVR